MARPRWGAAGGSLELADSSAKPALAVRRARSFSGSGELCRVTYSDNLRFVIRHCAADFFNRVTKTANVIFAHNESVR